MLGRLRQRVRVQEVESSSLTKLDSYSCQVTAEVFCVFTSHCRCPPNAAILPVPRQSEQCRVCHNGCHRVRRDGKHASTHPISISLAKPVDLRIYPDAKGYDLRQRLRKPCTSHMRHCRAEDTAPPPFHIAKPGKSSHGEAGVDHVAHRFQDLHVRIPWQMGMVWNPTYLARCGLLLAIRGTDDPESWALGDAEHRGSLCKEMENRRAFWEDDQHAWGRWIDRGLECVAQIFSVTHACAKCESFLPRCQEPRLSFGCNAILPRKSPCMLYESVRHSATVPLSKPPNRSPISTSSGRRLQDLSNDASTGDAC